MASIDVLLEGVMPEAPNAPLELARQHLMRAVIDMCKRALAWSVWSDPIALVAEQHTYPIPVPDGAELVIVRDVQVDHVPGGLPGLDLREITRRYHDWREHVATPACWVIPERGADELRLVPMPGPMSEPVYLHIRAAYQPTRASREVPDWLVSERFDDLCAGAKSTLLMIPKQEWTDTGLAGFYKGVFEKACDDERVNTEMDQVTGSVRVVPRRFGR